MKRVVVADIAIEAEVDEKTVVRVLAAYFKMRSAHWQRDHEARGKRWGRPSRVDDKTRAAARVLRSEGKSIREVARLLAVPRTTIARALTRST